VTLFNQIYSSAFSRVPVHKSSFLPRAASPTGSALTGQDDSLPSSSSPATVHSDSAHTAPSAASSTGLAPSFQAPDALAPPAPSPTEMRERVEHLTQIAQTLFSRREYQAAAKTCDEALALDPQNADLLQLRTRIQQTMQILGVQPEQPASQRQEKPVSPKATRVFTHTTGFFRELEDGKWEEQAADGKYHFTEQSVDSAWIYLRDSSRNINVRLPLNGGWCAFQRGPLRPKGPWNNLYSVTTSR
jgi:hypothetical protein